jgi:hypothetical protein
MVNIGVMRGSPGIAMLNVNRDCVGAMPKSTNDDSNGSSTDLDENAVRMKIAETEIWEKNVREERKKMLYQMKRLGGGGHEWMK